MEQSDEEEEEEEAEFNCQINELSIELIIYSRRLKWIGSTGILTKPKIQELQSFYFYSKKYFFP